VRADWPRVLGGAALLFVLGVSYLELRLALRGIRPTVVDSPALWIQQRARASALGERALVLVGASRIQLDADLDVLRVRTGLEPVQLAIDGSNFRPVLAGLAADPAIRGTVIVDVAEPYVAHDAPGGTVQDWQAAYERAAARPALPDFATTEGWLGHQLHRRLRSYADGAQPLTSLLQRILPAHATQQYLVTLPDRARLADYAKVDLPALYYARVLRNLGETAPPADTPTYGDLDRELRRRIDALQPQHDALPAYRAGAEALARDAEAIRRRGGRVFFVLPPTSGLVRAMEERRFPRAEFWDALAAIIGSGTLHYADVPAWQALECPDGSHLDFRQRAAFTHALVDALGLARATD
jgi:hypothetical protein